MTFPEHPPPRSKPTPSLLMIYRSYETTFPLSTLPPFFPRFAYFSFFHCSYAARVIVASTPSQDILSQGTYVWLYISYAQSLSPQSTPPMSYILLSSTQLLLSPKFTYGASIVCNDPKNYQDECLHSENMFSVVG